mgnify:CR=1 FL=1
MIRIGKIDNIKKQGLVKARSYLIRIVANVWPILGNTIRQVQNKIAFLV